MGAASSGLDDLSVSGTYTGTNDKRFQVRIVPSPGTDQFEWRSINVSSGAYSSWSSPINCSTG